MAHRRLTILSFLGLAWVGACSAQEAAGEADLSSGSGATGGTGNANVDQGGTTSGNPLPPEKEDDDTYTAPVVSGHWIWTANPLSGKVALIDAKTLRVSTADAGLAPTYVAGLGANAGEDSAAIVLNVGNDTASVLHATNGVIDVESVKVHTGANRMTVSESGRWALVWSDAKLLESPDPTEGLQDVTVLDLTSSPPHPYSLTVGYRPSRVTIGAGEKHAYFVTEPGVSVVELPAEDPPSVTRDVSVVADPTEAATVRDVTVTPDGAFAIVRRENKPTVSVVSLDDESAVEVTLPGPVTDLDLSPDGDVAFAVVRGAGPLGTAGMGGNSGTGGSSTGGTAGSSGTAGSGTGGMAGAEGGAPALGGEGGEPSAGGQAGAEGGAPADAGAAGVSETSSAGASDGGMPATAGADSGGSSAVGGTSATGGSSGTGGGAGQTAMPTDSYVAALPLAAVLDDPTAFKQLAIKDTVGSIAIAPAGSVAVLYTTATDSDHLVILNTDALKLVRTVLVQSPITTVLPAPDGENAVALLRPAAGSKKAGGFSLIPLTSKLPPKLVGTDAPPQSVALGEHEALITTEGSTDRGMVHAVYLAELPGFGTTEIKLASPPLSAGLIPEVDRGFVAQSHPEGRITFIELASGQPHTITGFELSARVVQDD